MSGYAGFSNVKQAQVLAALRATYPEIRVNGWKSAVIKDLPPLDTEFDSVEEFAQMVMAVPFIPDGFVIESEPRDLVFFEVEVTHPMSADKLRNYGKLAIDMAAFDVNFAVLVYNKYGHCNVVDLVPYYGDWLTTVFPEMKT